MLESFDSSQLPSLVRLAHRMLGSPEDAEEVVQAVFLEVLGRPNRMMNVKNWNGFLRHMVIQRSIDRLRKRKDCSPLEFEPEDPSENSPVEIAMNRELLARFRNSLVELNPREAEVFSLRYFSEKSNGEIAEQLKIAPNAVAVLLRKARSKLQKILAKEVSHDH